MFLSSGLIPVVAVLPITNFVWGGGGVGGSFVGVGVSFFLFFFFFFFFNVAPCSPRDSLIYRCTYLSSTSLSSQARGISSPHTTPLDATSKEQRLSRFPSPRIPTGPVFPLMSRFFPKQTTFAPPFPLLFQSGNYHIPPSRLLPQEPANRCPPKTSKLSPLRKF